MKSLFFLLGMLYSLSVMADLAPQPYVGADFGYRAMSFKQFAGRSEWKHELSGMNGFTGIRMNWLGLEFGGHLSRWSKRDNFKHRITGCYINALGHLPLSEDISVFTGVGVGHMKIDYARFWKTLEKETVRRAVPRVLGGFHIKVAPMAYIRLSGTMELTKNVKHCEWRPHNSTMAHAGLVLQF